MVQPLQKLVDFTGYTMLINGAVSYLAISKVFKPSD